MGIVIAHQPVAAPILAAAATGAAQAAERRRKLQAEMELERQRLAAQSADRAADREMRAGAEFQRNNVFVPAGQQVAQPQPPADVGASIVPQIGGGPVVPFAPNATVTVPFAPGQAPAPQQPPAVAPAIIPPMVQPPPGIPAVGPNGEPGYYVPKDWADTHELVDGQWRSKGDVQDERIRGRASYRHELELESSSLKEVQGAAASIETQMNKLAAEGRLNPAGEKQWRDMAGELARMRRGGVRDGAMRQYLSQWLEAYNAANPDSWVIDKATPQEAHKKNTVPRTKAGLPTTWDYIDQHPEDFGGETHYDANGKPTFMPSPEDADKAKKEAADLKLRDWAWEQAQKAATNKETGEVDGDKMLEEYPKIYRKRKAADEALNAPAEQPAAAPPPAAQQAAQPQPAAGAPAQAPPAAQQPAAPAAPPPAGPAPDARQQALVDDVNKKPDAAPQQANFGEVKDVKVNKREEVQSEAGQRADLQKQHDAIVQQSNEFIDRMNREGKMKDGVPTGSMTLAEQERAASLYSEGKRLEAEMADLGQNRADQTVAWANGELADLMQKYPGITDPSQISNPADRQRYDRAIQSLERSKARK